MKKTLEIISGLKEQGFIKDYAIGGAVAAIKWIEPFLTKDLDIFVIPAGEIKKFEVLVIDGMSEDMTREIIKDYTSQHPLNIVI